MLNPSAKGLTQPTLWGGGDDRRRVRGDRRHGYEKVILCASSPTDAVAFLVFVVPRFMNARDSYVLTGDPIAHAVEPLISTDEGSRTRALQRGP